MKRGIYKPLHGIRWIIFGAKNTKSSEGIYIYKNSQDEDVRVDDEAAACDAFWEHLEKANVSQKNQGVSGYYERNNKLRFISYYVEDSIKVQNKFKFSRFKTTTGKFGEESVKKGCKAGVNCKADLQEYRTLWDRQDLESQN